MGYRIDYVEEQGTLAAIVRGSASHRHAADIGRDIALQAGRCRAERLLIDLRGLVDRIGALGSLLIASAGRGRRTAVLDAANNEAYYAFPEAAARAGGLALRHFSSPGAALHWLAGEASSPGDRNRPRPGGPGGGGAYATYQA